MPILKIMLRQYPEGGMSWKVPFRQGVTDTYRSVWSLCVPVYAYLQPESYADKVFVKSTRKEYTGNNHFMNKDNGLF